MAASKGPYIFEAVVVAKTTNNLMRRKLKAKAYDSFERIK